MWKVKKDVFIDRRVKEVHCFATNPKMWHYWYEGLSETGRMDGAGGKGTTVDLTYHFYGRAVDVNVTVRENRQHSKGYTWRCQVTGAFSAVQTWNYIAKGQGTEVQFEMDYALHSKVFGKIANTLYVKRLMHDSMEQTLQNLKAFSESE